MLSRRKWAAKDLFCSCRQPWAEIHDVSGHPKSANPDVLDLEIKMMILLNFALDFFDFL